MGTQQKAMPLRHEQAPYRPFPAVADERGGRAEPSKGLIMADVTPINSARLTPGVPPVRPARVQTAAPDPEPADRVEISDLARLLSSLDPEEQTRSRAQRVADLREAIASGAYQTDDKIDYVVSRLMDVLRQTPREAVAN
jgi:anti-sigma28 factor (negative regulator of flagellin synthesis)